jgi:DNA-binding NtrC family response regulator
MNKIVVTDGSSTFAEFLRQELEDEGYKVQLARDAREVTAMLQRKIPDITILGTFASINAGMAIVEHIQTMHPGTPIILFVSCDEAHTLDDRIRFATACVEKSDDLTTLKRVISKSVPRMQSDQRFRFGLPPTIRE